MEDIEPDMQTIDKEIEIYLCRLNKSCPCFSVLQRVAYNSIRGAYCINSYHAEQFVEKYDLISALMMPQPGTEPGPLTIRVSVLPITLLGTSRGPFLIIGSK